MKHPLVIPDLEKLAHKGTAGRLLCVCGNEEMPGAAILCARAAQRAGAGLVTLACVAKNMQLLVPVAAPETVLIDLAESPALIAGRLPESITSRGDHARVVGCGLGASGGTKTLVHLLLESFDGPLVLDADGLNALGSELESLRGFKGALVLTPHPGEASRLLGRSIPSDGAGRVDCAKEISERAGAICVLKGHETVVTSPDREHVNTTGNSGMATAGAGDVLSGMLGAYLAWYVACDITDRDVFDICVSGVHLHGLAGDLAAREKGRRGVIASDLIDFLPAAQLELLRTGG